MLVTNISNRVDDIPEDIRQFAYNASEGVMPLTPEKKYVVSGLWQTKDHLYYLIVDDEYRSPWFYPSDLFAVDDSQRPADWIEGGDDGDKYITFPELADDRTRRGEFANNLEDNEDVEVTVFRKYYDKYREQYKDKLE